MWFDGLPFSCGIRVVHQETFQPRSGGTSGGVLEICKGNVLCPVESSNAGVDAVDKTLKCNRILLITVK